MALPISGKDLLLPTLQTEAMEIAASRTANGIRLLDANAEDVESPLGKHAQGRFPGLKVKPTNREI
jgi:hypothetical protein